MGLFDRIGDAWTALDRGGENVRQQLFGLITGRQGSGGLNNLFDQFKQKGLGGMMRSWIDTGPNEPIAPNQLEEALGRDKIQEIATKLGVREDEVKSKLSELLPKMVDEMTPNGRIEEQEDVRREQPKPGASLF
jgi:uncharacterized protein YidB (DUF937 family)